MRQDLTERLLGLGEGERLLLADLYQVRFADAGLLARLEGLCAAAAGRLQATGLLRAAALPEGTVYWLTQSGVRAARTLLDDPAPSGQRAYAALRLRHELLRAELYVALRALGLESAAYRAEPRLAYRSAAGLGVRTIVPDALIAGGGAEALVEVDRGSEGEAALRAKWLRYREWRLEDASPRCIFVLALQPGRLARSLADAGLAAEVGADAAELAARILAGVGGHAPP